MWSTVIEWLAAAFGATRRGFGAAFTVAIVAGSLLSALFAIRWGYVRGFLPAVGLLALAALAAHTVAAARDELWRAACLKLENPMQKPREAGGGLRLVGPTAAALSTLAHAVSAVRRGELVEANNLTQLIDRALLRPEEARLLDAVRAMISLGMGDNRRAAQQGAAALPTRSPAFDEALGRVVITDAWGDPARLKAIDAAWEEQGAAGEPGAPLGRLHRLVRLRLGDRVDALPVEDARALCDEARAIGDDGLALELEARARSSTYR